jgi:hypothetical protein
MLIYQSVEKYQLTQMWRKDFSAKIENKFTFEDTRFLYEMLVSNNKTDMDEETLNELNEKVRLFSLIYNF